MKLVCRLCGVEVEEGNLWRDHIMGKCTDNEPLDSIAKYIEALQSYFERYKSRQP